VLVADGWRISRNKNHVAIWDDAVGRIEFEMNGRVFIHVHKLKASVIPQQLLVAKAKKCAASAFINSGVIFREDVGFAFLDTIHEFSHEAVFPHPEGKRFPYLRVDAYEKLGFKVIVGDDSDPTGVEVHFNMGIFENLLLQLHANSVVLERQGQVSLQLAETMKQVTDILKDFTAPKSAPKNREFGVV
jgi:hypothetical protein